MNLEEYTAELKKRLEGLSETDINDAISYCEEYFNEAEDEEAAINELGSPAKFAAQLKAEAVIKETKSNSEKQPNIIKSILWIFMGICALPIALPLLLTAVILLFTALLLAAIFVLVAFVMFWACVYTAITSFITGFMNIGAPADFLIHIGFSLICIGIAALSFSLINILMKKTLPFFIQKLSDFYHRHKGGKKDEAI